MGERYGVRGLSLRRKVLVRHMFIIITIAAAVLAYIAGRKDGRRAERAQLQRDWTEIERMVQQ